MPRRLVTSLLALAVFAAMPATAWATDLDAPVRDTPPVSDVAERPVRDKPVDERPVREDPAKDTADRQIRDVTDHRVDDVDHRRCLRLADNPRRCHDFRPDDPVSIRKLIWRLIHAGEWKKLVRLLHALGWL